MQCTSSCHYEVSCQDLYNDVKDPLCSLFQILEFCTILTSNSQHRKALMKVIICPSGSSPLTCLLFCIKEATNHVTCVALELLLGIIKVNLVHIYLQFNFFVYVSYF